MPVPDNGQDMTTLSIRRDVKDAFDSVKRTGDETASDVLLRLIEHYRTNAQRSTRRK